MKHAVVWACGALLLAGCVVHNDGSHEWVRKRASQDLSCPMGQLTIYHYTDKPHEKGAVGCGKGMVYLEQCQGASCRWVADPSRGMPKRPK